jgi:hypothetical protein
MRSSIEDIALNAVDDRALNTVINKLKAEAEHSRKERIYKYIDKLKAEIARLEQCL